MSYLQLVYFSSSFVLLLMLPTYTENVQQARCARRALNLSSARGKLKTGGPFVLVKFMSTPLYTSLYTHTRARKRSLTHMGFYYRCSEGGPRLISLLFFFLSFFSPPDVRQRRGQFPNWWRSWNCCCVYTAIIRVYSSYITAIVHM